MDMGKKVKRIALLFDLEDILCYVRSLPSRCSPFGIFFFYKKMELFHFVRLSICFYIKKDKSYKGVEDFLYVCHMKGFMRK